MSGIWALDLETTLGAPRSIKNLRHENFHRLQQEIEHDRPPEMKGKRRFIAQNLTDPAKIDKAIEERLKQDAQLDRDADALNPLTAAPVCVVCINMADVKQVEAGFADIGMAGSNHFQIFTDASKFYDWAKTEPHQFLGFNIKGFDLPVLKAYLARTTDGQIPEIPALWRQPIDIAESIFMPYDRSTYSTPCSLKYHVASILDIEAQRTGPVKEYLESDFTGANVAAAYVDWEKGGEEKIIKHCTLDALMCALIAKKLRICW